MKKIYLLIFVLALVLPNNAFTQHNKTVTLTVSGEGNTKQEALQTALRNAIEQAFGAFISSNTKILNNELVKDEIVSISNGNIQDYEIISEIQRKNGLWNSTVKTIVSIDKLTSFSESKGITVEFEGAIFAANVKQQELNKENEETVVENMSEILKELQERCFDYKIATGEPQAYNVKSAIEISGCRNFPKADWKIPITVHVIPNKNLKEISNYFSSTLNGISISREELNDFYKNANVDYYQFILVSENENKFRHDTIFKNKRKTKIDKIVKKENPNKIDTIYLRNENSIMKINNFLDYFRKSIMNFQITNNNYSKMGHELFFFVNNGELKNSHQRRVGNYPKLIGNGFTPILYFYSPKIHSQNVFSNYSWGGEKSDIFKYIDPYPIKRHEFINVESSKSNRNKRPSINYIISFENLNIGNEEVLKLKFNDFFTTDEISKITKYKIEHCPNEIKGEYDYSIMDFKYSVIKNLK